MLRLAANTLFVAPVFLLFPLTQGCQPVVTYHQYYAPTTPLEINLTPEGDQNLLQMFVEPTIANDVIRFSLSTARIGTSLPTIEIACQEERLTTALQTLAPITGSTFTSEYHPPRREVPYCTDLIRPTPTGHSHHAYKETGLRHDVFLAFIKPSQIDSFTTDSAMEAIDAKTKSAFGLYCDWFEIRLPSLKVDGVLQLNPACSV